MSKLDELIKELCPNGVEYKELWGIAKVTIGEFVHKDKQSENAEYPVYNGGISNTGYYDEYNEEKNKIIKFLKGKEKNGKIISKEYLIKAIILWDVNIF